MATKLFRFLVVATLSFASFIYAEDYKLHKAIENQDFEEASKILQSHPEEVNFSTLIDPNFVSSANFLLNKTKNYILGTSGVQIHPNLMGHTTLELAIIHGAPLDLIKELVAFGQDINLKRVEIIGALGNGGHNEAKVTVKTPLFTAIEVNRIDIIEFLIENGADIDHVVWKGTYMRHVFNTDFWGYWLNFDQIM